MSVTQIGIACLADIIAEYWNDVFYTILIVNKEDQILLNLNFCLISLKRLNFLILDSISLPLSKDFFSTNPPRAFHVETPRKRRGNDVKTFQRGIHVVRLQGCEFSISYQFSLPCKHMDFLVSNRTTYFSYSFKLMFFFGYL